MPSQVLMVAFMLVATLMNHLRCQESQQENTEQSVNEAGSCSSNNAPANPNCEDTEIKPISITFVNNYHKILSLHWIENDNTIPRLIELGVEGNGHRIQLGSYTGHRFRFTRPGTHILVGPVFVINNCQTEYVVPADAHDAAWDGACFDSLPEYCEAIKVNCLLTPGWMVANCPKTCNMCDIIDRKDRCLRSKLNISEESWLKPGTLHTVFEGMLERGKEFSPQVVSREPEGPWMIVFDNFVTDEEIDAFLKWGKHYGFARSTDTGPQLARGQNEYIVSRARTSTNCWCGVECKEDPIVDRVYERVEKLTLAPRTNYEDFQLLKYEVGQFYGVHHDMHENPEHRTHGSGPRTLTVFLYLSDVEEGGETGFPIVNISVAPKKGRMVVWPSIMNDDIYAQDKRTFHEAKPVIKGVKYGSNLWIHTHDFLTSNHWECH